MSDKIWSAAEKVSNTTRARTEVVVAARLTAVDGLAPRRLAVGRVRDANVLATVGSIRVVVAVDRNRKNHLVVVVGPPAVTESGLVPGSL
jgi:hypothetical protein